MSRSRGRAEHVVRTSSQSVWWVAVPGSAWENKLESISNRPVNGPAFVAG